MSSSIRPLDESTKPNVSENSRKNFPRPPVFDNKFYEREFLKFRLAQAFRIFGHLGFDEGVAGHITVRGLHFSLIQPSDLILVDHEGNILDESGPMRLLNTAAFEIHSAIHAARPDVLCAAHSHTIYGRAFSALGRELDIITQDACAFYKDHSVYMQFNGAVLAKEESSRIAAALGNNKVIILQNHGLLVATSSIESTVHYFSSLEKCCHVQLTTDAVAGRTRVPKITIGDKEAVGTYQAVGAGGWFSGRTQFQALEAREGKFFEFK
ncbi:hypothetical protein EW145_g3592 [Phellinidium pouzarii]|uniref:Class II aldolase/adducin N-terminal domain-containing protein n=1 Tax=Phellinidium pouzarii TaxID=167371 RepID=A0A4S4L6K0_9AGAM|nr:hypothetical protein EW145_g3592 [Phellinidium pouzarii]